MLDHFDIYIQCEELNENSYFDFYVDCEES